MKPALDSYGMLKLLRTFLMLTLLSASAGSVLAADKPDTKDCKDHPLLTRMPGYWLQRCDTKEFDRQLVQDGNKGFDVEGRVWKYSYFLQPDRKEYPSELQIHRNFENAVTGLGGRVTGRKTNSQEWMKVVRDGMEYWIEVRTDHTSKYWLTIVEKKAMQQDVVADAAAMSNGIGATGHVALYGIFFDSGESVVKPESEAALAEIAKLLNSDAALNINVVGHTDNVGTMDFNTKLSRARAEAIVKTLVGKHGIDAKRLQGYGVASLAPVASNDSEEGRAKNRRVELVKR